MDIIDCLNDMLSSSRYYNKEYDIEVTGLAPLGTGFVVIKKELMNEFIDKLQEFNTELKEIRKSEKEAIRLKEAAEEMLCQAKGQYSGECSENYYCHEEKKSQNKKINEEPSSFYFPLGDI